MKKEYANKLRIALLIQNAFLIQEYSKEHSKVIDVNKFICDFKLQFNIHPLEMNYNNEGYPMNIKHPIITEEEYIKGCLFNDNKIIKNLIYFLEGGKCVELKDYNKIEDSDFTSLLFEHTNDSESFKHYNTKEHLSGQIFLYFSKIDEGYFNFEIIMSDEFFVIILEGDF